MNDDRHAEDSECYGLRRLDGPADAFYVLCAGINRIGTRRDNQVVISAPGVSRLHAELHVTLAGVTVADLASKNGTTVNDVPCEERGLLQCGDEIGIGTVRLRLERVPSVSTDLAIHLSSWQEDGRRPDATDRRADTETQLAPGTTVSTPWSVLEAFGEPLAVGGDHRRVHALAKVLPRLGAAGAAWLTVEAVGAVVLCATAGTVPMIGPWTTAIAERSRDSDAMAVHEGLGPEADACGVLAPVRPSGDRTVLMFWALPSAARDPLLLRALALVAAASDGDDESRAREGASVIESPRPHALRPPPGYVMGTSTAADRLHHEISLVSTIDAPVLILGETGVGKEQIARLVYRSSDRHDGPFVAINCAAIPSELVEAELFGIDRGVATGVSGREGRFQEAHGGTLFLDEIGELSLEVQVKLLRVLQEREVQPLGRTAHAIDVRIIAATNASLRDQIAAGRFRADLYFRLAGALIHVPSLRDRIEDLPALVEHFTRRSAREMGRRVRGVTVETLHALASYPWPGNIRELENEVRRLVLRCSDRQPLRASALSDPIRDALADQRPGGESSSGGSPAELELDLATVEWRAIRKALAQTEGNQAQAARLLGISRFALRRRIEQHEVRATDSSA